MGGDVCPICPDCLSLKITYLRYFGRSISLFLSLLFPFHSAILKPKIFSQSERCKNQSFWVKKENYRALNITWQKIIKMNVPYFDLSVCETNWFRHFEAPFSTQILIKMKFLKSKFIYLIILIFLTFSSSSSWNFVYGTRFFLPAAVSQFFVGSNSES